MAKILFLKRERHCLCFNSTSQDTFYERGYELQYTDLSGYKKMLALRPRIWLWEIQSFNIEWNVWNQREAGLWKLPDYNFTWYIKFKCTPLFYHFYVCYFSLQYLSDIIRFYVKIFKISDRNFTAQKFTGSSCLPCHYLWLNLLKLQRVYSQLLNVNQIFQLMFFLSLIYFSGILVILFLRHF